MTRRIVHRAVDSGFEFTDLASSLLGGYVFSALGRSFRVNRGVPYGNEAAHRVDIYQKASWHVGRRPVVLYIHGGAFRFMSRTSHWPAALMLARSGFLAVMVEYRLAPKHPFPAGLMDVTAALDWTRRHIAEFGGDPERIVLAGDSAGANLALGLAIVNSFPRNENWTQKAFNHPSPIRALLPSCGFFESVNSSETTNISPLVRERIELLWENYHQAQPPPGLPLDLMDPVSCLEKSGLPTHPFPPTFCVSGERDPVRDGALRLEQAVAGVGAEVEAKLYPSVGHDFHMIVTSSIAREAWRDQITFAQRHCSEDVATP